MGRSSHEQFEVNWFEKLVINFALPSDFVYHSFRALFTGDKSQTWRERMAGLWAGKVSKYQKLLRVKAENDGHIPEDYCELSSRTPCGRVRLFLARIRSADEAPQESA